MFETMAVNETKRSKNGKNKNNEKQKTGKMK